MTATTFNVKEITANPITTEILKGIKNFENLIDVAYDLCKSYTGADEKLKKSAEAFAGMTTANQKKQGRNNVTKLICKLVGISEPAQPVLAENQLKPSNKGKEEAAAKVEGSTPAPAKKAEATKKVLFPTELKSDRLTAFGETNGLKLVADITLEEFLKYTSAFVLVDGAYQPNPNVGARTFYIAQSWSKSDIKEYDYSGATLRPCPKEFEFDLDIQAVFSVTDDEKVESKNLYTSSITTQAIMNVKLFQEGKNVFDDIVDGSRFDHGVPFQVYESNMNMVAEPTPEAEPVTEEAEQPQAQQEEAPPQQEEAPITPVTEEKPKTEKPKLGGKNTKKK